jgi:hypothetical protein
MVFIIVSSNMAHDCGRFMINKLAILLFLAYFPCLTFAAYSCSSDAVAYEGDISSDVKIKCGPPMDIDKLGLVEIHGKFVNLERWIYNPGYGKFYQILEFQNGVLISIKNGPRVK